MENTTSVDTDALIKAFLQGAGLPGVAINWQATPEFMELLGRLLAISVDGAFDLLKARASLKREVHAETTMVVVRGNNPLKFLSDSPSVMTQMLRKKMPGFMGPAEALEDAYEDLRAHQQCVLAGMQGVVDAALSELAPEQVAASLPAPSMADKLIPARRQTAMWEAYVARHAQLSGAASADFQAVFGKAFMQAYERQDERLQDERDGA